MKNARGSHRSVSMKLVMGLAAVTLLSGCEKGQEFRAAATDSLQTGLNAIADGIIDGLFAVFEPDTTSSTTSGN